MRSDSGKSRIALVSAGFGNGCRTCRPAGDGGCSCQFSGGSSPRTAGPGFRNAAHPGADRGRLFARDALFPGGRQSHARARPDGDHRERLRLAAARDALARRLSRRIRRLPARPLGRPVNSTAQALAWTNRRQSLPGPEFWIELLCGERRDRSRRGDDGASATGQAQTLGAPGRMSQKSDTGPPASRGKPRLRPKQALIERDHSILLQIQERASPIEGFAKQMYMVKHAGRCRLPADQRQPAG